MAKYEVVRDSDGETVLNGQGEIVQGAVGPEIRYEGLSALPIGEYHVVVGIDSWALQVVPDPELEL